MPLNWNIEKCANYKELTNDEERNVTDSVVWATMAVGINQITKQNFEEFYRRLHIVEETNGTFLMRDGKARYITQAEVGRRIGLYTNAGTVTKLSFDAKHKQSSEAP